MIHLAAERPHHRPGPRTTGRARPLPHPLTPYAELIVNFCPTGMIPTKAMTPHVPVSPAEVVDQSCLALDRGIAIVHLHARDDEGSPTYLARIYEEMILGIRGQHPDAIVCVSCSGRNFPEFERRSEVLELTGAARPDLASLTLTSLDFPTGTSQNDPEMVIALGQKMVWRPMAAGWTRKPQRQPVMHHALEKLCTTYRGSSDSAIWRNEATVRPV
jgi:uncharacterized protein (DUF849 family)